MPARSGTFNRPVLESMAGSFGVEPPAGGGFGGVDSELVAWLVVQVRGVAAAAEVHRACAWLGMRVAWHTAQGGSAQLHSSTAPQLCTAPQLWRCGAMVPAQVLSFQQLVGISLHEGLHDVDVFDRLDGRGSQGVPSVRAWGPYFAGSAGSAPW